MLLAIVLSVAGALVWIAATLRIDKLNPDDPRKRLVTLVSGWLGMVRDRCARSRLLRAGRRCARPFLWLWNFGKV